jgi:hypothetical protein
MGVIFAVGAGEIEPVVPQPVRRRLEAETTRAKVWRSFMMNLG